MIIREYCHNIDTKNYVTCRITLVKLPLNPSTSPRGNNATGNRFANSKPLKLKPNVKACHSLPIVLLEYLILMTEHRWRFSPSYEE
jgi:hypothetical protein